MGRKNSHLIFKALADTQRLRIIKLIKEEEVCNCNLSNILGMPPSTLAHHMKVLIEAGVVNARKSGKWTYYTINKREIQTGINTLKEIID